MPSPRLIVIDLLKTEGSVPTRRNISKFWAKLGGMPLPRLIVIDLLKTAKRGFLRLKISADYLNILISIDRIKFVQSALIYSLLAPLFRRLCRHLLPIQLFILIIFSDECEDFFSPTRLFYGKKCPPSAE